MLYFLRSPQWVWGTVLLWHWYTHSLSKQAHQNISQTLKIKSYTNPITASFYSKPSRISKWDHIYSLAIQCKFWRKTLTWITPKLSPSCLVSSYCLPRTRFWVSRMVGEKERHKSLRGRILLRNCHGQWKSSRMTVTHQGDTPHPEPPQLCTWGSDSYLWFHAWSHQDLHGSWQVADNMPSHHTALPSLTSSLFA